MTGRDGLLSALDTRWVATVLADAEAMARVSGTQREAARQSAADRVRAAYRELADDQTAGGAESIALTDKDVIDTAAEAAGAVAGLLRVNAALRDRDHASNAARWRAELSQDEQARREIRAIRQRLSRARKATPSPRPARSRRSS